MGPMDISSGIGNNKCHGVVESSYNFSANFLVVVERPQGGGSWFASGVVEVSLCG